MAKILSKKKKENVEGALVTSKVTNNTIEKKRQEVLEKGKKFKYPVQYSKHKLVINTIIIIIVVAIITSIAGWFQFYKAQSTSTFSYRVSLFLPLPVADVDGEKALYSDYLAQYRSNISVTERQEGSLNNEEDETRRSNYYKRQSMDNTVANTYAIKLARENNISVTDDEIEEVFNEHRKTSNAEVSESVFNKIIEDNYKLSPKEYRRMFIELPLLKQKVSAKIDTDAEKTKNNIAKKLSNNDGNFEEISQEYGQDVEVSSPGFVKSTNIDGGRTKVALSLEKNEVSKPFISKSGDGYYIVKLLDKKDDEVSYSYIKIPFKEFDHRLTELREANKISEYITVE
ncbi:SurA N-terminal domain-containing protein [Candidatus Saccharibacteria bacterium]|nr:SurA N-terminal domain-containing protein [Candidatus Saccharibacteria bacterium]